MKKFTQKITLFLIANILFYHFMIYLIDGKGFLVSACNLAQRENFDFIMLGTSHTQVFYNHVVEKILPKKMKNLATGSAGVVPEKIRLLCFFESKNSTKNIIYILDPWALYSERWNENNIILQYENIEYSYTKKLISNGATKTVLFNYFRDKLTSNALVLINSYIKTKDIPTPQPKQPVQIQIEESKKIEKTLEEQRKIDEALDKQRLEILYDEGLNQKRFSKYSQDVVEIIKLAKANHAHITFIIPPTLMGKMPGHEEVIKLLEEYKQKYNISYLDLTDEMQDQQYYWDREHFNENGVNFFTEHFLSKILN